MEQIECSACEKKISPNAITCPHCGEPSKAEKKGFLQVMAEIHPVVTPLMIGAIGGIFTFHQKQKDDQWMAQEREIAVARAKADRAIELLDYLVSEKDEKRRMSILLSLAIASQQQLPEGLIPVLIQQGTEDTGFGNKFKYALIDLKREADAANDVQLIKRVDDGLKTLFHPEVIKLLNEETFEKREKVLKTLTESLDGKVKKADMISVLQDAHQVIKRGTHTPDELATLEDLIVKKIKVLAEEAIPDSKIAMKTSDKAKKDSVSANEVLEVAREILRPEDRKDIFKEQATSKQSINRLVIAINDESQRAMAVEIGERLTSMVFAQTIENVRENGLMLPEVAEIRYLKPLDDSLPKPLQSIQKVLGDFGFTAEFKGYPEKFVSEGEYEIWFGDGQTF